MANTVSIFKLPAVSDDEGCPGMQDAQFRLNGLHIDDNIEYSHSSYAQDRLEGRNVQFANSNRSSELEDKDEKTGLVLCFGEMLIDFVPTLSGYSLADAPSFKKAPGGAPANVSVAVSRLGGHSAFIGKVGDDEFGHMLKGILVHNGVDSSGVRFDTNARTALAFVTLQDDGERSFMFYRNPSADMLLQESELDTDLLRKASIFHYGSISLIAEPCRSTHLAAMKIAKNSGALLSYDPNLRLPLWPSAEEARKGILSIWNEADIIKVSDDEVQFLTSGEDPDNEDVVRQYLWHPGLKLLLITMGQAGCKYYTKTFHGQVPGFKVSAIDATGAGDAFVGGMLSQLVGDTTLYQDEERLREALRFANACGALTTTERGAIPALPDKDTVLRLINVCEKQMPKVPSWQNISQWRVPSRQPSRELLTDYDDA
ncbi:hypothetical protein KP509_28G031900 [Ceratopteris richardii]|nr:hypothetical protein KP509_28G031900 [Ceratopteris richardii]KAH7293587.1 hypothetical protein KP509_28G031900 [Ceratopteris richardii]KAH7293590.1 hypothetical protein KP509_28G031900 [Ceratopteris richardii]KAH7293591.1 hypothetical protein KP509_28G031900 [Ceratopteris richardii]